MINYVKSKCQPRIDTSISVNVLYKAHGDTADQTVWSLEPRITCRWGAVQLTSMSLDTFKNRNKLVPYSSYCNDIWKQGLLWGQT